MLTANRPYLQKFKVFLNNNEADYLISGDELTELLEHLGWSEIDHPRIYEKARAGIVLFTGYGYLRFEQII